MKNHLVVLAVAGALSGTAHAQQAGDAEGQLQEVHITAAKYAQDVQKSSLSITVLSADALQKGGVSQAEDLGALVPGLTVSEGGGTVQTYLRGVGSFATDASAESAIAYNINGVYIARPDGIGPVFFDLERVEVLEGPQGTLYGRNATGGAINLITTRPSQELSGYASLDIGNYDLRRVSAAIGGGVTDTLSVRAAGQYSYHEGYLTDGYDDEDSTAARLSALWKPNDKVSLLLIGEYSHSTPQGEATVARSSLRTMPSDPWTGPSASPLEQPPTAVIPGGTSISNDGSNDVLVKAVNAQLDVNLGFATLTFLPAFRSTDVGYLTYTPGFWFQTAETSREQSYELRLGNSSDALKWVTGLYYFNEAQTQLYQLQALPIQESTVNTPLYTKSYAAFADATYSLTSRLRLIGGLRYSNDDKTQEGDTTAVLPAPSTTNDAGQRTFVNTSWRAGAEYDLTERNMLYATAATGFKAGGFFPSVPAPNNSFAPEKLTAFTLGSRNRFMDQRLQVNLEAFYWNYRNKQERYLGATPGGTTGLLTVNAGKATLYGADLDVRFKPTSQDLLWLSAEYLHTRYDSFTYDVYNASVPGAGINSYPSQATGCTLGPVVPDTANDFVPALRYDSTQAVNCAGQPLVRAPQWTGTVGYERSFPLPHDLVLKGSVDAQFSSGYYLSPDFIASAWQGSYVSENASLGLETLSHWQFSLWGRNLSDESIYTGGGRYAFSRGVAAGGDPTLFYANIRAPRTFGFSVKKSF